MGKLQLALLTIVVIAVVVFVAIPVWAHKRTKRHREAARRIGANQWILRKLDRNGSMGTVLILETNDQQRGHETIVFKLSHPDYHKFEHLKGGELIIFVVHQDPVYKDGYMEVSGFLRVNSISRGPVGD